MDPSGAEESRHVLGLEDLFQDGLHLQKIRRCRMMGTVHCITAANHIESALLDSFVPAGFTILDRVRNLASASNINFDGPNRLLVCTCCRCSSRARPTLQFGYLCERRGSFRISYHQNELFWVHPSLMFGVRERSGPLSTIVKSAVISRTTTTHGPMK